MSREMHENRPNQHYSALITKVLKNPEVHLSRTQVEYAINYLMSRIGLIDDFTRTRFSSEFGFNQNIPFTVSNFHPVSAYEFKRIHNERDDTHPLYIAAYKEAFWLSNTGNPQEEEIRQTIAQTYGSEVYFLIDKWLAFTPVTQQKNIELLEDTGLNFLYHENIHRNCIVRNVGQPEAKDIADALFQYRSDLFRTLLDTNQYYQSKFIKKYFDYTGKKLQTRDYLVTIKGGTVFVVNDGKNLLQGGIMYDELFAEFESLYATYDGFERVVSDVSVEALPTDEQETAAEIRSHYKSVIKAVRKFGYNIVLKAYLEGHIYDLLMTQLFDPAEQIPKVFKYMVLLDDSPHN